MLVQSSTQNPSEVQSVVARVLGVPYAKVVCECRRMGGAFGGKEFEADGTTVALNSPETLNAVKWNVEMFKYMDPSVLSWLDPDNNQAFLTEQTKAYEEKMWATVKTATAEADNCNSGVQPCTMGKLAKTTIVPVKPEEAETHKKLVEGAVLAGWAKRCGAECTKEWNDTVGKALGLKAPTP